MTGRANWSNLKHSPSASLRLIAAALNGDVDNLRMGE